MIAWKEHSVAAIRSYKVPVSKKNYPKGVINISYIKGAFVGGSVILAFVAGMLVMYKLSEHYQKIIRYWIQAKYDRDMDPLPMEHKKAPKPKPRIREKPDPLMEVQTDEH